MPNQKLSDLLSQSKEILSRYRKNAIDRGNDTAKKDVETVMRCIGKLWGMACGNNEEKG